MIKYVFLIIMIFHLNRSADSNLLQFALKVIIDAAIIKNHEYIEYKYYVFSGEKSNECFEFIGYYYTGPIINRCLPISTGNTRGGIYLQSIILIFLQ